MHFGSHSFQIGISLVLLCRVKIFLKLKEKATFIPVQRIYGKFVPAVDVMRGENVLEVCPLMRKLQSLKCSSHSDS